MLTWNFGFRHHYRASYLRLWLRLGTFGFGRNPPQGRLQAGAGHSCQRRAERSSAEVWGFHGTRIASPCRLPRIFVSEIKVYNTSVALWRTSPNFPACPNPAICHRRVERLRVLREIGTSPTGPQFCAVQGVIQRPVGRLPHSTLSTCCFLYNPTRFPVDFA